MTKRPCHLVALALLAAAGCKQEAHESKLPPITDQFADAFERDEIGGDYLATAADAYHLANGSLQAQGAHNRPLWLRRALPPNAEIELDTWSQSAAGDIKVEIYGDGHSFDPDQGAYTSTGYVLIMGGWNNSKSIIARRDEHGKDVVERSAPKVERGRRYHWKIVRNGGQLDWFVDDMSTPFLSLSDPSPLTGPEHAFFAFDNWESNVGYDNLVIRAR